MWIFFRYDRFEVLAVFSSTMLAGLGSFFIVKEWWVNVNSRTVWPPNAVLFIPFFVRPVQSSFLSSGPSFCSSFHHQLFPFTFPSSINFIFLSDSYFRSCFPCCFYFSSTHLFLSCFMMVMNFRWSELINKKFTIRVNSLEGDRGFIRWLIFAIFQHGENCTTAGCPHVSETYVKVKVSTRNNYSQLSIIRHFDYPPSNHRNGFP